MLKLSTSTSAAMGNSGDRSGEAVAVIIFFLSLSTVAVSLRCYCRIRVVKSFGWEDWLAIMAHVGLHFIQQFRGTSDIGGRCFSFPPAPVTWSE